MKSVQKVTAYRFIFIMTSLVFLSGVTWAGKKEIPVSSGRSMRQQIETQAEFIEKEFVVAKNNKERLKIVKKISSKFASFKKNSSELSDEDQQFLAKVLKGFAFLPQDKKFKQTECAHLQKEFLSQFPVGADGKPQEFTAHYSWNALQSFCQP